VGVTEAAEAVAEPDPSRRGYGPPGPARQRDAQRQEGRSNGPPSGGMTERRGGSVAPRPLERGGRPHLAYRVPQVESAEHRQRGGRRHDGYDRDTPRWAQPVAPQRDPYEDRYGRPRH